MPEARGSKACRPLSKDWKGLPAAGGMAEGGGAQVGLALQNPRRARKEEDPEAGAGGGGMVWPEAWAFLGIPRAAGFPGLPLGAG